jgi:sigma-E factor negative regulatory protein RseA
MSDSLNEQVSACVDGENDPSETALLLRRLSLDDGLRSRWARYHLISDALKNNLPDRPTLTLADRIHEAVAQEATPQPRFSAVRLLKPAAGFAIAASVAALAVFAVRSVPTATAPAQTAQIASATAAPQYQRVAGTRWNRTPPEVAARLNAYMLNHSGHAGTAGMQAVLPYVRIVGYDVGQ